VRAVPAHATLTRQSLTQERDGDADGVALYHE
jgi:hypothetical protein